MSAILKQHSMPVILTPKKEHPFLQNSQIVGGQQGIVREYLSADAIVSTTTKKRITIRKC